MVGTTLTEIRDHVEELASRDGAFYLVCGRTGEQPIPAAGKRFDGRATARSAARATERYRTALRRYDPHLPHHDLIVCEDAAPLGGADRESTRPPTGDDRDPPDSALDAPALDPDPRPDRRVEFCHRVAAAVFETLSDGGYGTVETAVMDAYLDLAETVSDSDELCVRLLESMARELDAHLSPAEQADVLARAVTRLTPIDPSDDPITAAFDRLQRHGLLGRYARSPVSSDLEGGTESVVVRLSGYALSPRNGRLPTLPVVFALSRHRPDRRPTTLRVADCDDGWRVTVVLATDTDPGGLTTAPIRSGT